MKQKRTWDTYHTSKLFNGHMDAHYEHVCDIHKNVLVLYKEPDREKRRLQLQKASSLYDPLYDSFLVYLENLKAHVRELGFESLIDWVFSAENDPINWRDFFSDPLYQQIIRQQGQSFAQGKRRQLKVTEFAHWDYWYQPHRDGEDPFETHPYFGDFESSVAIIKRFYDNWGLSKEISQVNLIQREDSPTHASIDFENGNWNSQIYISEVGAGTVCGSFKYCSSLAHEYAHAIQGFFMENPTEDNFMPPYLLSEAFSVFFERLFGIDDAVKKHISGVANWTHFQRYMINEQKDLLTRMLSLTDFELRLYDAYDKGVLDEDFISTTFSEILKLYFGIEKTLPTSHLWQRDIYYLTYSPLKSRTYVYGVIFAEALLKKLSNHSENRPRYLKSVLQKCSRLGCLSSWEDYLKSSGLNYPIDVNELIAWLAVVFTR